MAGPRNKPPSNPELDFSDLNEVLGDHPSEPSAAPTPGGAPGPPARDLLPPPPRRPTPFANAPLRGGGAAPRAPSAAPPGPVRDKWHDLGTADDLFGALPSPPAAPAPGAPAPAANAPPRVATHPGIAAPRLPTLGPEPEFSFGLETDAEPPAFGRAASPSNDVRPGGAGPDADLSWGATPSGPGGVDDHDGSEFALPLATGGQPPVAPDERPTPRPPAMGAPAVDDDDENDPTGSIPTPLPARPDDFGDAYSLVHKASLTPAALAPPDPRHEMIDRFALGDFSGALVIAEALTAENRADAQVARVAAECRTRLEQMYASRLGAMNQIPMIAVPRTELKWLSLDHRAGFVLSLVDGASSIEEIIDVAGMPPLEVLRTLFELLTQRVIEFKPRGRAAR